MWHLFGNKAVQWEFCTTIQYPMCSLLSGCWLCLAGPAGEGGPTDALPVIVVSTRHVPRWQRWSLVVKGTDFDFCSEEEALAEYNAAHIAAAEYMMLNILGQKTVFQVRE